MYAIKNTEFKIKRERVENRTSQSMFDLKKKRMSISGPFGGLSIQYPYRFADEFITSQTSPDYKQRNQILFSSELMNDLIISLSLSGDENGSDR